VKYLIILLLALILFFVKPAVSHAQSSHSQLKNEFERGRIVKIIEQGEKNIADTVQHFQVLEIKILTGQDKGKVLKIEHGIDTTVRTYSLVKEKDEVVLSKLGSGKNTKYFIFDKFRLPSTLIILAGFFALVVGFARFRGVTSILGMLISLLILLKFIVPSIAKGADPVGITLIGSFLIVFISIFLAHGFYKRTAIAVGATVASLVIAIGLSHIFVNFAHLTGAGSDDAYSLQFGNFANINLKGLLLSGIIIGTLGVLDDITTSLSAAVEQISHANPKLDALELYKRGIEVGREHVTSLVNTLILAYAGTSMPVFLFFIAIKDTQPLWVTLNTELIIEEVIRALVGSTALVLAVPITTLLAAVFFAKNSSKNSKLPVQIRK
jgi:uncharacterized membrane protein